MLEEVVNTGGKDAHNDRTEDDRRGITGGYPKEPLLQEPSHISITVPTLHDEEPAQQEEPVNCKDSEGHSRMAEPHEQLTRIISVCNLWSVAENYQGRENDAK
jgi:hypothetical protein